MPFCVCVGERWYYGGGLQLNLLSTGLRRTMRQEEHESKNKKDVHLEECEEIQESARNMWK